MRKNIALVLAGGKGSRLEPLTRDRAKPAVPFGGSYRIIDFSLSNCLNSGFRRILVLTQYKAASLDRHIQQGWRFLCRELNEYIDVLPPQQRIDEHWYQGTADAVYQNIYTIEKTNADNVLILSGDHIYKMDYQELLKEHVASNAAVTIGCLPVSIEEGREFGVMAVDEDQRVIEFQEKPDQPKSLPGDSDRCLASMGIYAFKAEFLYEELCKDATIRDSSHDFGKDIIPRIIDKHLVRVFPFKDKNTDQKAYWRDVGTIDAYYEANMDLISVDPQLNLYDQSWPIRCYQPLLPPPKFVFAQDKLQEPRMGYALDSLVCSGSILSGGRAIRSIISSEVRINSWAYIEDSILFDGVNVGRHAKIRRAIIDKGVTIPEGMTIGYDEEEDRRRGFTISDSGIAVIGKVGSLAEGI